MIHEEINKNKFNEPLTENGEFHANNDMLLKLQKLNIKLLLSSPCLQVLETLNPYLKNTENVNINIEYSLLPSDIFYKNKIFEVPNTYYDKFRINKEYNSILDITELKKYENQEEFNNRIVNFMTYLIKKYMETDITILIATHPDVIKIILNFLNILYNKDTISFGSIIRI